MKPLCYIFGYGSLISSDSRARSTSYSGKVVPVTVEGIARGWNLPAQLRDGLGATVLGAVAKVGATCNGVLIEVSEEALADIDRRELEDDDYYRQEISPSRIAVPPEQSVSPARAFAYFASKPRPPDGNHPLIQSYIDVVLAGCLDEYGQAFAEELVTTTEHWQGPWVNDRANARYLRPLRNNARLPEIDSLLGRLVPDAFANRASPAVPPSPSINP